MRLLVRSRSSGAIFSGEPPVKQSTPRPSARGLLERRRVAGRDPHRRVRLRVRLRQHVALRHREELAVVRVACRRATCGGTRRSPRRTCALGVVGIVDAEARACSVVDEPRPVPNSKRPSERWSSIATRSATRAGWFTGGVMLMIAEPDVDALRAREHVRHHHLGRRDVRVLLEEVVLGRPHVLPVVLVADLGERHLAHEAVVLGVRVGGLHVAGT